ncbi:unnamed protein product, partial [Mesorhabditis belari]|uniref:Mitochondrial ribosomal protein S17 n=1 Tax=Mesorhabditis belari TaxID=2138241 RepID=A0AAF3F048_9BILA
MRRAIQESAVKTDVLLGRVVKMSQIGIDRIPCAQVRCQRNEFNTYLKMYFSRSFDYWAIDRGQLGNLGDTVMIRNIDDLSQRPTAAVTHKIDRVVFQYGNVIDPVTGKRVINDDFMDDIELKKKLVHDVLETPAEQESLLFAERRALQRQLLENAQKDDDFREAAKAIENKTL